jgi:hypothetical protein
LISSLWFSVSEKAPNSKIDLDTSIQIAASAGSDSIFKKLLKVAKAHEDERDISSLLGVAEAIAAGHQSTAKRLIEFGAKVDSKTIFAALHTKDPVFMRYVIEHRTDSWWFPQESVRGLAALNEHDIPENILQHIFDSKHIYGLPVMPLCVFALESNNLWLFRHIAPTFRSVHLEAVRRYIEAMNGSEIHMELLERALSLNKLISDDLLYRAVQKCQEVVQAVLFAYGSKHGSCHNHFGVEGLLKATRQQNTAICHQLLSFGVNPLLSSHGQRPAFKANLELPSSEAQKLIPIMLRKIGGPNAVLQDGTRHSTLLISAIESENQFAVELINQKKCRS